MQVQVNCLQRRQEIDQQGSRGMSGVQVKDERHKQSYEQHLIQGKKIQRGIGRKEEGHPQLGPWFRR